MWGARRYRPKHAFLWMRVGKGTPFASLGLILFLCLLASLSPSLLCVRAPVMADEDTYVSVAVFAADAPTWAPRLHYLGRQMDHMPVIKVPEGTVRVGKYGKMHDSR